MTKSAFVRLAPLLVVTTLAGGIGWSGEAVAQDAAEAGSVRKMDAVVVTATRRPTDVQDIPISVVAVDAELLEDRGAANLFEAAPYLPGLTMNGSAAYNNFPLGIRGIASSTSLVGSDDPVAVYLDGVYIGKPSAVVTELLGLDHVEVIRGPQGALYGRNATAGALLLVRKTPPNEMQVEGNLRYGSFDQWRAEGRVAGPLSSEGLSGSLNFMATDRDGWGTNNFDGSKSNYRKSTAGLGSLQFDSGALSAALNVDYVDETVGQGFARINAVPFAQANPISADDDLLGDPDEYNTNYPSQFDRTGGGASLNVEIDLGGGTKVHSVTGYRFDDVSGTTDSDGTSVDFSRNQTDERLDQFVQTLYAAGGGTRSEWLLGADFYAGQTRLQQLVSLVALNSSINVFADNETRSGAVFGEYTYGLTDRLRLTGAARYSQETKRFEDRSEGAGLLGSLPNRVQSETWDSFTPSLRASFDATEDVLLYASLSTGFKSGGFTVQQAGSFDPENVLTYEAGLRSTYADGRVLLNGAIFSSEYKDLQVRVPISFGVIQTRNAGKAKINGFEMETAVELNEFFNLSGYVTYLDATYDDYIGPGNIQNAGQRLSRAPEWQGGVTFGAGRDIKSGRISGELAYTFRDQIYFQAPNLEPIGSPAFDRIDARAEFATLDDRWSLALVGRNITDERHVDNVIILGSSLLANFNEPASWYLQLRYRR